MKRMIALALALTLLAGVPAMAAFPDPLPPAADAAPASGEASSSGEPSAERLPLVPGVYEGEDGSVLTVEEDGAASFETLVSGRVNGRAMSGRLTFVGTRTEDGFSFTRVKFFMLDLTDAAASLGYTSASHWEEAAAALYRAGLEKSMVTEEPAP